MDELSDDVISTDRRSISWEHSETAQLRDYLERMLREVARQRRSKRRNAKSNRRQKDLGVDKEVWTGSIRSRGEADAVGEMLDVLVSPDSEISDEDRREIVDSLRRIAPEHADFHWRHLHPSLQEACRDEYLSGNFYGAIQEAAKRYVNDLRRISGIKGPETAAIQGSFGGNAPKIDVMARWKRVALAPDTVKNIREAQHKLSEGIWSGFRNPLSHEERGVLEQNEVFTCQDCLDALSMLSELRRRLDQFESKKPSADTP